MNYLYLIGCLILGMIFYHFLKGFCGCRVVEGSGGKCSGPSAYCKNATNETVCKIQSGWSYYQDKTSCTWTDNT